ncbi:MAG: hypothetical protein K2X91_05945 [Thermoleophilia bacterium]|nr:hypothetical protein [Thermoleophilia bacterium]
MTARSTMWRRGAVGLGVAAAIGAGLVLPATGAGAVAAVQDDILTTAQVDQIAGRVALLQQTRARVTRFDVLWSTVAPTEPADPRNPADPAYDWSRVDAVMTQLAAARIVPIVSVYSTPDWAVIRPTPYEFAYNPNAPRPAAFRDFMYALAKRYNGTFPNPAGTPATLPRVRHFEIWNEPNLKNFFRLGARSNLAHYKKMVRAAYPAIKRANRRAIVIIGVGGPRSTSGQGNVGARQWMRGLVLDRRVKLDAYSQHIYPAAGPRARVKAFPSWNSVPEILQTLNRRKRGMKLYITEAGYTTARTDFRNVRVSVPVQNRYLNQIFRLPAVRSTQVAAVVWFNLQDNVNWPAGLLRADGSRKPSLASFVRFARRPIPAPLRRELAR